MWLASEKKALDLLIFVAPNPYVYLVTNNCKIQIYGL